MTKVKKMLAFTAVAALAFVSFSAFALKPSVKCVGSTGYCRITLPDGTVAESTGNVEVATATAQP
ncbi:MAG: hypothetical protein NTW29_08250 [Bacteroidetes bacterium]|nr:hypothetical protein [Bacteroidota bacterium]